MPNLDRSLRRHMTDTVYVMTKEEDHRGQITYGIPVPHRAFVKYRYKLIDFESGISKASNAEVYLAGDLGDVRPEEEIELPDGKRREVLTVSHWTDGGFLVVEV